MRMLVFIFSDTQSANKENVAAEKRIEKTEILNLPKETTILLPKKLPKSTSEAVKSLFYKNKK